MLRTIDREFDAVVTDRDDRIVALVEVKAHPATNWPEILPAILARFSEPIDFVLAVDLHEILVYRVERGRLGERLATFSSPEILSHYDPGFASRRIFEPYLTTLAEAWLRDLAYHWKSGSPPGAEQMGEIGLLRRLEGGTTVRAHES